MTVTSEPIHSVDREHLPHAGPPRGLVAAVVVLALAVVGLAGWLAYEMNSDEKLDAVALTPELEQLFSDYLGSWSEGDRPAFEGLVTNDYTVFVGTNQWLGGDIISSPETMNATQTAASVDGEEWTIEHLSDPIIARENPWFISVNEKWTSRAFEFVGTASYVIEEHDGKLLVASHYWTGMQEYLDR